MKLDSVVYTVAGMAFGVILGWVIGSQQLGRPGAAAPAPQASAASAAPASGGATGGRTPPTLDQPRVTIDAKAALERGIKNEAERRLKGLLDDFLKER